MASNPENTPERRINILGKELRLSDIGIGGFFLLMTGIWAGNQPCLGAPLILCGLGAMTYSTLKK